MATGAQTFAELQARVAGQDFTGTYSSEIIQAIVDGIDDWNRTTREPGSESTFTLTPVIGTASYTVTNNVRVLNVYDLDSGELAYIDRDEFTSLPTSSGRPTRYTQYGNSLVLWPTPDLTSYRLRVDYIVGATKPINGSDVMSTVTGIPETYLYALVCFARTRLFEQEDDFQAAAYWAKRYSDLKAQYKGDVARRNVGANRQIRGAYRQTASPRVNYP